MYENIYFVQLIHTLRRERNFLILSTPQVKSLAHQKENLIEDQFLDMGKVGESS